MKAVVTLILYTLAGAALLAGLPYLLPLAGPFLIAFTAAAVIGSYKKGRYADYPRLIEHYRCRAVTIHTPRPTTANLDGEIIQWDGALTFRLAEERVRFVYPRGLVWRGIGRAASESRARA